MKPFGVAMVLLLAVTVASAQSTKYGASVVNQKKGVDFTKFKSYSWTTGQPAALPDVDKQIVSAIESELTTLGMTKAAPGPGDVLIAYAALRRTDVNVKAKPDAAGAQPQYAVGTVYFTMLDPKDRSRLLQLRLDKPITLDPAQAETAVKQAMTELFTKYPTRQKK